MSKKRTGLLIAFGAFLGAAVAGIAYYLQYKSFNDELDRDFHDYEEEDASNEEKKDEPLPCQEAAGRNYITLDASKGKPEKSAEDAETETSTEAQADTEEDMDAKTNAETAKIPANATIEEDTEGEFA